MKRAEVAGLLELLKIPGLGSQKARLLVTKFPKPQEIFHLSTTEICSVPGIDIKTARSIHRYKTEYFGEKEIERSEKIGISINTFWDDNFPYFLKKIFNPPVLLYTMGVSLKKEEDCMAIVGTRNPTAYGKTVTKNFSAEFVKNKFTIISGLARGIDTISHKETVKLSGKTIAVLGSGIDVIYPSENKKLAESILENGTIISEFPLGTKPDGGNFPKRNRIISGMSHGVLVVEAGHKSGAILTALNAVDQNRDVFVIPGRITDSKSKGCNRLIKHGAMLVDSIKEIIQTVQPKLFNPQISVQTQMNISLTKSDRAIMNHLSSDPIHIDELSEKTNVSVTHLLTKMLDLELRGVVQQLTGKQFISNL